MGVRVGKNFDVVVDVLDVVIGYLHWKIQNVGL